VSDTIRNGIDKTALSYWFPKLVEAGIPVPRTKIIKMPAEAQKVIWGSFDNEDANTGDEAAFFKELRLATLDIGFPCFLRTDHTSAKHGWNETCFVESFSNLKQHVYNIAEFSEIADMMGIPWDTWAVREFLPTMREPLPLKKPVSNPVSSPKTTRWVVRGTLGRLAPGSPIETGFSIKAPATYSLLDVRPALPAPRGYRFGLGSCPDGRGATRNQLTRRF
jgi:hypothetical protein